MQLYAFNFTYRQKKQKSKGMCNVYVIVYVIYIYILFPKIQFSHIFQTRKLLTIFFLALKLDGVGRLREIEKLT